MAIEALMTDKTGKAIKDALASIQQAIQQQGQGGQVGGVSISVETDPETLTTLSQSVVYFLAPGTWTAFSPAVTVPAGTTVFVKSHAVAGSLDLAAGSFVKIAATGTSVANAWDMKPEIAAINFALGLRVAGDQRRFDLEQRHGGLKGHFLDNAVHENAFLSIWSF